jgi:hypothetical protein
MSAGPAYPPGFPVIALPETADYARSSSRRRDAMYATPPSNKTMALPAALGSSSGAAKPLPYRRSERIPGFPRILGSLRAVCELAHTEAGLPRGVPSTICFTVKFQ